MTTTLTTTSAIINKTVQTGKHTHPPPTHTHLHSCTRLHIWWSIGLHTGKVRWCQAMVPLCLGLWERTDLHFNLGILHGLMGRKPNDATHPRLYIRTGGHVLLAYIYHVYVCVCVESVNGNDDDDGIMGCLSVMMWNGFWL